MFGRIRSCLTYSNVLATLSLFAVLGGSSYAALTITGKSVKDRSLTGNDIKKKSVPLNRLRGRLPAGPRGATGPQGVAGQKGGTGAKGDPGNPAASGPGRSNPTGECDPLSDTAYVSCTSVELAVPAAGRVLLVADAQWFQQTGTASGRCRFTGPETSNTQIEPGGSANQGAVALNEVTSQVAAGTHTFGVECREFSGDTIRFDDYMISAVYVGGS